MAAPVFHSVAWGRLPEIYVPVTMQRTVEPEWDYLNDRKSYWLTIAGRLRPEVTLAQAAASLNALFLSLRTSDFTALGDQSAKARQEFIDHAHLNVDAGARGFSPLRDDVRTPLTIIMGMVLLVVAMAIVNVASLLLVRGQSRAGVQRALCAGRDERPDRAPAAVRRLAARLARSRPRTGSHSCGAVSVASLDVAGLLRSAGLYDHARLALLCF